MGLMDAVLNEMESLISGEGYQLPSKEMRGKGISYAAAPKQAGPGQLSTEERIKQAEAKVPTRPVNTVIREWRRAGTLTARDWFIEKFQNARYAIKKWQHQLAMSEKLIVGEKGFNNIADQISLAFGRANFIMKE